MFQRNVARSFLRIIEVLLEEYRDRLMKKNEKERRGGGGKTEGAKNENVANASPGRHFLESLRHGIK